MKKSVDSVAELMRPFFRHGEEAADYATSGNYYEWYFTYAERIKPTRILEIGARLGYSAIAMLLGHPGVRELTLLDDGSYGFGVGEAVENIRRVGHPAEVVAHTLDTQSVRALPLEGEFDLIHVDGDHTFHGAMHDLSLVLPYLSPSGVIILDDVDYISSCKKAARQFLSLNPGLESAHISTFRGHILLGYSLPHPDDGERTRSGMAKDGDGKSKSSKTTRRQFFGSAGRGTLLVGGIALVGTGGALTAGCSDDEGDGNEYPSPGGGERGLAPKE